MSWLRRLAIMDREVSAGDGLLRLAVANLALDLILAVVRLRLKVAQLHGRHLGAVGRGMAWLSRRPPSLWRTAAVRALLLLNR